MNATPNLPDVSVLAAPVYVVLIAVELFLIHRHKAHGEYETRDATTSLLVGTGSVVAGLLLASTLGAGIAALLMWAYSHRITTFPFVWWAFIICFVLDDFRYYWSHRLQHRVRWCWASHVVHHSSQHFNLSTALRQPWLSGLTGMFVLKVPLALLGFHPVMIAFVTSINLFYQFFVHTEAIDRLPRWFEGLFNTPSHHRVHHGRNARYLDANYAGVLIIWDKLFGTFVPELKSEPVEYGLVKNIGTFNPLRVAVHEYVAILKDQMRWSLPWRARLGYVLRPPGWSHDGSRMGSEAVKRDFLERHPTEAGMPGLPHRLMDS